MKFRILLFSFLSLLILPGVVFADVAEECDDELAVCLCDYPDGEGFSDTTSSINNCLSYCQTVRGDTVDFEYSVQCDVNGNYITIDSGNFGEEVETGSQPESVAPVELEFTAPVLNVDIPGLSFTDPTLQGGEIQNNLIGEYIEAIYQWLIGAAALVAVVLIMIGGMQWILARGDATAVGKAKKRIGDAVTGLVLLLFAYTIASIIDPRTLDFDPLSLKLIDRQDNILPPDGESWEVTPRANIPDDLVEIHGDFVTVVSGINKLLNEEAAEALAAAGEEFKARTGKSIVIKSGTRDLAHQADLFYRFCLDQPGHACDVVACNPAAGSNVISGNNKGYTLSGDLKEAVEAGKKNDAIKVLVENANVGNCPHTSTVAVDAWCPGSSGYQYDPACQLELIGSMINNGFCRITLEPWHFEFDKYAVSSSCSTTITGSYTRDGQPYTPDPETCARWSYGKGNSRKNQCIQFK